ncbi:DUF6090 family protein [Muriicola soli]|uniref:Uncharacterized protein n=1 Tax=Muriicola soli TaxID=2507538 RepID=A0A411E8I3_9FLAO|nr:DUF6090 family protein [Muriicola soli]QBA63958.1 hypothetical protein EQY75_05050 [Muriicola soli]
MEKNKTGKYLKYAIGEIVLVVIGILIALSINNWNIEKNNRIEEVKILKNLRSDFEASIKELDELDEIRKSSLSCIKTIFSIIETKTNPYSEKQLDSLVMYASVPPTYNGQMGTLEMLFNSGKVNIISNDEIKNLLITWPGLVDDVTEEEIILRDLSYNQYDNNSSKYLSKTNQMKLFKYRNIPFQSMPNGAMKSNYDGYFKDSDIENNYAMRMSLLLLIENGSENLVQVAKYIINKIDIELKNNK